MNARMDDQALQQFKKTIEMDANFAGTYADLSSLYRYRGQYDFWLDAWKKNATLNNDSQDSARQAEVARIYGQSGYKAAVARNIELLKQQSTNDYIDPSFIATEYAFLGDKERAFQRLEKAFAAKSEGLSYIRIWRAFDFLRSDPRYADLEKRVNLPQ